MLLDRRLCFIVGCCIGVFGEWKNVIVSRGLRNLGNTCYLNAQLQCAFHIPTIRNMLLLPTTDSRNNEGLEALRCVIRDMMNAALSEPNSLSVVTPLALTRTLGIPVMEQQDTQEFWKLLLPALNFPNLTGLYQGFYEDYLIALDGSQRERRRNETFLDLSLNVGDDDDASSSSSSSSLLSELEHMFATPELLRVSEGNGWKPDKDGPKVDAYKGLRLLPFGLPAILQFHLKRFRYDWNTQIMEKLNHPFTFPIELNLTHLLVPTNNQFANQRQDLIPESIQNLDHAVYDLQSVVVHAGEFGMGHYYSYVRPNLYSPRDPNNPLLQHDEHSPSLWYRFNDHLVTPVSLDDVLVDATGGRVPIKQREKQVEDALNVSPMREQFNLGGFWKRIQQIFSPEKGPSSSFGYGGPTSNAYVLQYVRRSAIPLLYHSDQETQDGIFANNQSHGNETSNPGL